MAVSITKAGKTIKPKQKPALGGSVDRLPPVSETLKSMKRVGKRKQGAAKAMKKDAEK